MTMDSERTSYERGHELGKMMAAQRATGDGSYDARWDIADEGKRRGASVSDFIRGMSEALSEGA